MKLLVTGATGFLGKHVLKLLIDDPRVETIHVFSRRKHTHPHPKVKMAGCDLSDPASLAHSGIDALDAVVHLAGLYSFESPFRELYLNNVLATHNLVQWLKKSLPDSRPVILSASTYAVGIGQLDTYSGEEPVRTLPSRKNAYAHCKALAEKTLAESGYPVRLLRLGVLVGDERDGEIEKVDGPYHLLSLLHRLRYLGKVPFPCLIPLPARRDAVLPLVPVDAAARVFAEALFLEDDLAGEPAIYGVYNPNSLPLSEFAPLAVKRFLPRARVSFVGSLPTPLLKYQTRFTKIPSLVFDFTTEKMALGNPRFTAQFAASQIPAFSGYQQNFFEGFEDYLKGYRA